MFKTFSCTHHVNDWHGVLCYVYKDEKVLHRRSIVNEIVSVGGTNFSTGTIEAFIAELKKNLDDLCNYCLRIFYTILSSVIDRSWDETCGAKTQ